MRTSTPASKHSRFHLKTLEDLRSELSCLGVALPLSDDLGILGEQVSIAGKTLPNRFVTQPMEGFDSTPDGSPQELTFRRYLRYAEGGVGLIWFEATAVMHEGRSNPGQLFIHDRNVEEFARLVRTVRKAALDKFGHAPLMIIQLTHSGRYSKPSGVPQPIIAHRSPILDPKHSLPDDYPVVTDDYLDRLQDAYVHAAKLAARAGFDGVDIKSCHRYLVSELLASHTREGRYGGSFENRTRMLRETAVRISNQVPEVFVTTRMNAYDAIPYPYGFGVDKENYLKPDLTEPIKLARLLQSIGTPILNVSIGNPYLSPHVGRPCDFPLKGMGPPPEHPLAGIARFTATTGSIQKAVPDLPVVGAGYAWLRHLMPHVAAGCVTEGLATLVGQGRGSFAYPQSVLDIIEKGAMDPAKCCTTCSACTQLMRDGFPTGCAVRDSSVYGRRRGGFSEGRSS